MKKLILILIMLYGVAAYSQNDFILLSRDYPIIDVVVNGKRLAMLIDTGSDVNIVDSNVAKRCDAVVIPTLNYGVGAGSNFDLHDVKNLTCSVKNRIVAGFIATEITDAFKPIEAKTGIKISGILGTPAIKQLGMIIDLSRGIVTIKADTNNLADK